MDLLRLDPDEEFLEATLAAEPGTMMEAAPLVYMKLKSPRRKDHTDVIEMIRGGIDAKRCRDYSRAHAPALVAAFDESLAQAEEEQDSAAGSGRALSPRLSAHRRAAMCSMKYLRAGLRT